MLTNECPVRNNMELKSFCKILHDQILLWASYETFNKEHLYIRRVSMVLRPWFLFYIPYLDFFGVLAPPLQSLHMIGTAPYIMTTIKYYYSSQTENVVLLTSCYNNSARMT